MSCDGDVTLMTTLRHHVLELCFPSVSHCSHNGRSKPDDENTVPVLAEGLTHQKAIGKSSLRSKQQQRNLGTSKCAESQSAGRCNKQRSCFDMSLAWAPSLPVPRSGVCVCLGAGAVQDSGVLLHCKQAPVKLAPTLMLSLLTRRKKQWAESWGSCFRGGLLRNMLQLKCCSLG